MTWRPQPEYADILTELSPEEVADVEQRRGWQPRAHRTPYHRETDTAYSWEPTEADVEAGRDR
jgi:hypothetical protein